MAGRYPKWSEPVSAVSTRFPRSHRKHYEQKAQERGLSLSEYIVVVLAEYHGLELPTFEKESDGQLPLSA